MNKIRKYLLPVLAISFFLLAFVVEHHILHNHPEKALVQHFQKSFLKQEQKLSGYLDLVEEKISSNLASGSYASSFSNLNKLFEKEGIGFIIYKDQKLAYWSDNHFAYPNFSLKLSKQPGLIVLPNGIYTATKRSIGNHQLIGLIHIKNNYSYENKFLENSFVAPFCLPPSFQIMVEKPESSYEIQNTDNQYVLSILPNGATMFNESQLYFPALLYLVGFVLLLFWAYLKIDKIRFRNIPFKLALLLLVFISIYLLHIYLGIPHLLNYLDVFSAKYYAVSRWLPSFGDFILIVCLFFFWSMVFVKEFSLHIRLKKWLIIPLFVLAGVLYQLVGMMIGNLIRNSNISYKLYQITDIDQFSIASYLAIAMLLFSIFMIHLKIIEKTKKLIDNRTFLKLHLLLVPLSILLCIVFRTGGFYLLALFFSVNLLQNRIGKLQIARFSLSYAILFISLFSITCLVFVYETIEQRDIQVQKLMAVNLSSEQDPVAEVFLANMQKRLNNDSIIPIILKAPYKDLENYLNRNYFDGHFRKYNVQYFFCTGTDSVFIQYEDILEPCFPYFEKMISQSGTRIANSSFFSMNSTNGGVSYIGKVHFPLINKSNGITMFITLDSKSVSEGIGFPELLMDRSLIKPFRYKYLSYAKYFDDELVNRSGDYAYNYYLQSYKLNEGDSEFHFQRWDGYDHIIYKDDRTQIVVSNRTLRFIDYLISFPYIFVFFFAFFLSVALIGNPHYRRMIIPKDLRFRIQLAIISVVLLSLLFVATGTIYYNIKAYKIRHQTDLQEKMSSISGEIDDRLINVNSINPELQDWLYTELYKLSNIFRTDINIYGVKGDLIATSRPEIFRKGITSERINAEAFFHLSEKYQLKYFQPEKIGKLSYLSAYQPILNNRGDYLGYLNLPYFTREDELKQSISTFVVAFINLYLILFLASVILAVFLSNKITLPLSLIREKLKSIQLGKKNEQINYDVEDEIGSLVREYNHKVNELAESAEMLARSERESAWREMAKQVAHEIKNPLTPMKLNIQYLQRAKAEKKDHYDDFFDRVTHSLIEQIDTLSGIATEFSNFAQIPKAKNEVFELIEVLRNVCQLFEPSENLHFTLEMNSLKVVHVFADKEQLSRAFINLIKNGIQAIPADQKGEIRIHLQANEQHVTIGISDNGVGISEDAREHLFQPNFTTKTSGMGLGLSIVQNIVESFSGKIWYETASSGTTFFVEIPLYQRTEKV